MPELRDQLQSSLGDAYSLERELGGGGMSRVFVATEKALRRQVVVKVLPPELAGGINVERFRREITTVAKLQHPHIVPVLAAGETDGLPYFTMPLVEGESLRARLAKGGELPLVEVIGILRDVCKALAYAHKHGIVHRDIKPDNVLLTGDSAVVTDFGVAKAVESAATSPETLTSLGVALGTPAYMAPEQATASGNIDHRADIYALGVMAYEMITGHSPFAGRSPQQMISAHVMENPAPIETQRRSVSPALARLIMRCLEKRPADRPQSVYEVLQELNPVAAPTATHVEPSAYAHAGSALREQGTRTWSAVVIMAILAIIAVPKILEYRERAKLNSRRVVVAPFTNLTGDKSLDPVGRIASDWITAGLSELDSVDVVSAAAANAVASDSGDVLRLLAERTRAGTVVSGSYFRQGDSLRFSAQVMNAATNRVVESLDPVMAPTSDPIAALTVLRDRLMSEIALTDTRGVQALLPPPKFAAYREFADGMERFSKLDWHGAIPYLTRAIALDSSFVMAYAMLSGVHFNLGNLRADDSVTALLLARRRQLRPHEQLFVDGMVAARRGDPHAELEIQRKIATKDSTLGSIYGVGWAALHVNRPREAIEAFRRIDYDRRPFDWAPYFVFYAHAHHLLGEHQVELKLALRGRAHHATRPILLNAEVRARAALGDVQRVQFLVDSIGNTQMDSGSTQAGTMRVAAEELRAHGKPRAAEELYERAVAWYYDDAARRPPTSARWRLIALAHYDASQLDSATAILERRIKVDTGSVDIRGMLGAIAARRGDTATALQTADWLDKVTNRYPDVNPHQWRAKIFALVGRKADAVDALRRTFVRPLYFGGWVHRTWEFESLRDYPAYVEVLRPKG